MGIDDIYRSKVCINRKVSGRWITLLSCSYVRTFLEIYFEHTVYKEKYYYGILLFLEYYVLIVLSKQSSFTNFSKFNAQTYFNQKCLSYRHSPSVYVKVIVSCTQALCLILTWNCRPILRLSEDTINTIHFSLYNTSIFTHD